MRAEAAEFHALVSEALAEVRRVEGLLERALSDIRERAAAGDPDVGAVLAEYLGVYPYPAVRTAVDRLHRGVSRATRTRPAASTRGPQAVRLTLHSRICVA